jgi:hypothetical protein
VSADASRGCAAFATNNTTISQKQSQNIERMRAGGTDDGAAAPAEGRS